MFRNSTLALVKQLHAVAENPDLLRAHGCLGQITSTLQTYLESPDTCIQLTAARALVTLSSRCSEEDWQSLDFSRARRVQALAGGHTDKEELERLLAAALERKSEVGIPSTQPKESLVKTADYGELTLTLLGNLADDERRSSLLKAVVKLAGVVSATFEEDKLLVVTRSTILERDTSLLGEIRKTVQDIFAEAELSVADGDELVLSAAHADGEDDYVPEYLDDLDDEDEEDDDDEGCFDPSAIYQFDSEAKLRSLKHRSCKVQEKEEDPAIAARLRRAKKRLDQQKAMEQARVERILTVITPQRRMRS